MSRWTMFILVMLLACRAFAADATPTTPPADGSADDPAPATAEAPAEAETPPPTEATVEERIEALILLLKDRSEGAAAVDTLMTLGDHRVEYALQRVLDRQIGLYQERPVTVVKQPVPEVPEGTETPPPMVDLYPVWADVDADGNPTGDILHTVAEADVASFRANSLVRRKALKPALALLGLFLDDAQRRAVAARELGLKAKTDALPKLRELSADDPDEKVRFAATEAVHLIVVADGDPEATIDDKLAAVDALGQMRSLRAYDLLKDGVKAEGLTNEQRDIFHLAIARIENHQTKVKWVGALFSGISLGTLLVLIALGLAITFGLMGVINMAHGEMVMFGAFTTWLVYDLCYDWAGDWYYVIAFPVALLAAAGIGMLIEWGIVRWLYKRPLDSMLATIGVSLVMIQAVRVWKGDNLALQTPKIFGGGWEIIQDVTLPYNRLFLIALSLFALLSVITIFKYTRFGLMLRATVQNREIAKAMGVNTRLIDLSTFALGSALAAMAGYGLVLLTSISPGMGQGYIVDSFLVTVLGGVGKLIGVVVGGVGIGGMQKILEPISIIEEPIRLFDATWAKVAVLLVVITVMTRRPAGLFPDKGRLADQGEKAASWFFRPGRMADLSFFGTFAFWGLVAIPVLYLTGMISIGDVNKYGYFATFAICALGLELLWGYMGTLSLCQFLFFALGGYAMGLYLINHGPMEVDGIPTALSVVMSDVGQRHNPWFLQYFESLPMSIILGVILVGGLAFVIGFLTFRSRVRGVYFAILTQAITVVAWYVFQKNEMKLGGTNGLTNFTHIAGYEIANKPIPDDATFWEAFAIHASQTRFWLYLVTVLTLLGSMWFVKWLVNSGFGRLLIATRDDETRLRFNGYRTWTIKTATFVIAAILACIGGMLYSPQMGIITPQQLEPIASIYVVIWVALGGRATVFGPVIGAFVVSILKDTLSSGGPDWWKEMAAAMPFEWLKEFLLFAWSEESWLLLLGATFILVPLLLPGGTISIPDRIRAITGWWQRRSQKGAAA